MNPSQKLHLVVTVSEIVAAGAVALLCDVLRVHNERIRRACLELQLRLREDCRRTEWGRVDPGSTLEEARSLARKLLAPTFINDRASATPTREALPAPESGYRRNWEMLLKTRHGRNLAASEARVDHSGKVNQAPRLLSLQDRVG